MLTYPATLLEGKFQNGLTLILLSYCRLLITDVYNLKVTQPLCWPIQALCDYFKGGCVEILILGFRNCLWLYLESTTENLPKLPLAAT